MKMIPLPEGYSWNDERGRSSSSIFLNRGTFRENLRYCVAQFFTLDDDLYVVVVGEKAHRSTGYSSKQMALSNGAKPVEGSPDELVMQLITLDRLSLS